MSEADVVVAGAASAASDGDEIDEDSCEDGELKPIDVSVELPVPDSSPDDPDELAGPAASAASLGEEIDEDSCELGELDPIESLVELP
ncbi:hypothetical protein OM076_24545 [Solirubrobacter ginsenosidimutans]|uniref:Uncharacterized protein n=1 Tax=Solirubrobacter ginsenosidimutans TaxID=490573 RepID=A0A9X3MXI7_9ACTN|nr:hypothetical protein [Solirubrobacter ginsenosidimutans]